MSNDEINRYIHFGILKNCQGFQLAPYGISSSGTVQCEHATGIKNPHPPVPDYCSDDSPRRLMHEVEETVIELLRETVKNPRVIYCRYLMRANGFRYEDLGFLYEQVIRSTAEQRAKACVEAHKALKTDSVVNT